jgi:hypothetical protein
MQHKTPLGVHRPTLKHWGGAQILTPEWQVDFFKQRFHAHGAGFVDHQAQSTSLAVFAHIDNALGEGIIRQTRHCDQKMMRQVDGQIKRVWYVHVSHFSKGLF